MTSLTSIARRVWKSAQLFVGFHRDPKGQARDTPHVWPPKNGRASIHPNPDEQESFVELQSAEGDSAQDVQIRLRPDVIVLRRDAKDAWEGVMIDEHAVTVKVGDVSISVNHDGSVTRRRW